MPDHYDLTTVETLLYSLCGARQYPTEGDLKREGLLGVYPSPYICKYLVACYKATADGVLRTE